MFLSLFKISRSKDLEQWLGQGPMERGPKWRFRGQARAQWAGDGDILVRGWRPNETEVRDGALPQSKGEHISSPFYLL